MNSDLFDWPVVAAATLCLCLLLLAVRYRVLYLRAEKERLLYSEAIDSLSEGFYRSSLDGRQLKANPSLVQLNGYDTEAEMLEAVRDIAVEWYVDPGRREEFRQALEADGVVTDFVSEIYRHKTRERIWISENARIVRDKTSGAPLFYEGSVREVTETIRRQQVEQRLEKLANSVPGGLFQLVRDPDGMFSLPYVSAGTRRQFAMDDADESSDPRRFMQEIHPDDAAAYFESLNRSGDTLTEWVREFRVGHRDGPWRWLLVRATPEAGADGTVTWHGYITDVSDRKAAEMKVRQLAYYDTLTGLPNRCHLNERLEQTLEFCRSKKRFGAVLFIDMDNFKILNDTRGHDVGDSLLRVVAEKLVQSVRRSDTVARFGGDEFVVILDDLGSDRSRARHDATAAARNVLKAFEAGCDLGAVHHHTTPSIGVVLFDGREESAPEVLKCADIAMYEAKKSGRNRFVVHDDGEMRRITDLLQMQEDLKKSIENDELELLLQPVVDAGGHLVSAEALMRWRHPRSGLVMPSTFIPLAEQSGFIIEINEWALRRGVGLLAGWRSLPGLRGIGLSVNVSVQQFHKDRFVSDMALLLSDNRVDPFLLTVELTEHVMATDHDHVARRMLELRGLGVRFSLDDFGTGYSSLAVLKQYPFQQVKIDGSFVSELETRSSRALVQAILAMARALDLTTVAEHVGTEDQLALLRDLGCDSFQGHLFGEPMTVDAFVGRFGDRESAASGLRIAASS